MALLLPQYRVALIEDLMSAMSDDSSMYYAIASNPVDVETVQSDSAKEKDAYADTTWKMLFGKHIENVAQVIRNVSWTSNTIYSMYDDAANNLSTSDFFVICDPELEGGDYLVFKCIYNANGAPSTNKPDLIQASTFEKADGYKWRYISSITNANYNRYASEDHCPVYANSTIVASADEYASVDVVLVANAGSGYRAYHQGIIQSVVNTTLIQISSNSSLDNDFYTRSGIYIYNDSIMTGQLRRINAYVANLSGHWVTLDAAANTTNILPSVTNYRISPYVSFDTDGDSQPIAFSTINSVANSIHSVTVIDPGYGISRASANIQSNTSYGSGAVLRPIAPPPGGHGFNPARELYCEGLAINFRFANTELNTIPTNVTYNRIAIIKDPYASANGIKGSAFTDDTFNQLLVANVSPGTTFTVGDTLTGNTSGAKGIVAFSNSTQVHLVGDQTWDDAESVSNGTSSVVLTIQSRPDIYVKDLATLYVQNIDNVERSGAQNEEFKLIIKV